ncbi:stealth family protein [Kitasatospora azatica]|uniref:stealth family protein n=1 Tax=Kitasatospora azatica TaxID=58347 RepID=UPI00068C22FC|nr:stealth family protein [Kitasatospora azatica]
MRCPRTARRLLRAVARRARRTRASEGQPVAPPDPTSARAAQPGGHGDPEPAPQPEPEPPAPTAEQLRRAREEWLLERWPGLVRADGRVAEVRDDLLSGAAFLRNFTETAEVLVAAKVVFAPMRAQELRHWVVIAPGQRAAVLAACASAFEGSPVYAELLGHDVTLATVLAEELPVAVAELEQATEDDDGAEPVLVKGVRIYRPVVTSGGTLHYGPEHGCDLDFWDSAEPAAGAIAAIHEPPIGWWVPSLEPDTTVRIDGREYPVPAAFAQPLLDDVTFPVDAVLTWVDDSDPAWRQRREQALDALAEPPATGGGAERFRSRDELRYCLRSIAMYAPWIRRVFLVTDGQRPDWLAAEHPALTLITHQELFADPAVLPVFNSHAIESQLHRIPELAEHFLYFNDDMFLGRPVRPEQFFQGNGVPLVNLDSRVIPPGPVVAQDDEYVAAQKNTRALVRREFGRHTTNALSHAPYPLTRALLADSAEVFAAELAAIARSRFRARTDVAPITLAVSRGYLTGRVAWGRIGHRYVDVDRFAALEQLPGLLRERGIDTFCLNDGDLDQVPRAEQDRIITAFLQDYFPIAGPFECSAPQPASRIPQQAGLAEQDPAAVQEPAEQLR